MQIKKLVPPLTGQWKAIYEKERPNLQPNAITGEELRDYVQTRFAATPITEEAYLDAIRTDVRNSAFFREKLHGAEPRPAAFLTPFFGGIQSGQVWGSSHQRSSGSISFPAGSLRKTTRCATN